MNTNTKNTVNQETKQPLDRLSGIIDRVSNLPTPPLVYQQINKVINDPRTSAFDIAAIITEDAAMSAKVLKLSNSAYYGLPKQVTSIKKAVIVLGVEAVRSLVLYTGVFKFFGDEKLDPMFHQEYWRHSLLTAVGSKLFACKGAGMCNVETEQAFSAGLLHDIGRLLMHIYIPEDFAAVTKLSEEKQIDPFEVENQLLDYNHCDLGSLFAQRWKLPDVIGHAIQYHHTPAEAGEEWNNVSLISLADKIAVSAFDVDEEEDADLTDIFEEAENNLGVSAYDVRQTIAQLREEYSKAETFVRMAKDN